MDSPELVITMDPVSFAKRIKEARQAAGLTQEQVAEACGITDGAVSAWEKEKAADVAASTLFRVADLLRVDARWLALGEGSDTTAQTALSEILRGLEDLPVEQQEAVRSLIRSLKR